MTNDVMNIWLVDDHQLFRAGFRTLLSRLSNVNVSFEASDGAAFLDHLNVEKPDLVFLDISMPKVDGLSATQQALQSDPDLKIVILSMFGEKEYYTKLVEMGIKGFLLKSCDFQEVELAIDTIRGGDLYFSRELLDQMAKSSANKPAKDLLSDREMDVLVEICGGSSNQDIADKLFISKRTVEKHRASLMMKTGCSNTASLVIYAVKNGLYTVWK